MKNILANKDTGKLLRKLKRIKKVFIVHTVTNILYSDTIFANLVLFTQEAKLILTVIALVKLISSKLARDPQSEERIKWRPKVRQNLLSFAKPVRRASHKTIITVMSVKYFVVGQFLSKLIFKEANTRKMLPGIDLTLDHYQEREITTRNSLKKLIQILFQFSSSSVSRIVQAGSSVTRVMRGLYQMLV